MHNTEKIFNENERKMSNLEVQGAANVLGQNNSRKNGIISKIFSNRSFYLRVSSQKETILFQQMLKSTTFCRDTGVETFHKAIYHGRTHVSNGICNYEEEVWSHKIRT